MSLEWDGILGKVDAVVDGAHHHKKSGAWSELGHMSVVRYTPQRMKASVADTRKSALVVLAVVFSFTLVFFSPVFICVFCFCHLGDLP